jgi:hypothetical protein
VGRSTRLNSGSSDDNKSTGYPSVFRGREGKLNVQIIQYLAQNGPSLIYSVAQHLTSVSETKIHYPTVNRRIHQLLQAKYLVRAGTKMTKAGVKGDLYALGLRGQFAALAGMPDWKSGYLSEPSPKEIRQLISTASVKVDSPFVLFNQVIQEGQKGESLVEKEFIPEIIKGVRSGFIDLDSSDENAISTGFASLIARRIISMMERSGQHGLRNGDVSRVVEIAMQALDKSVRLSNNEPPIGDAVVGTRNSAMPHWANELKVLLRLYSVKYE